MTMISPAGRELPARLQALQALSERQQTALLRLLLRIRNAGDSASIWRICAQEIGNDATLLARVRDALMAQGRASADACNDAAAPGAQNF